MVIRLNETGNPFTNEAPTKEDVNDTNDAIIDKDGFTLIDNVSVSHTGDTNFTIKKTYTFNKAVDGVKLKFKLYNSSSSQATYMTFYLDTTQILTADLHPLNEVYSSGTNLFSQLDGPSNQWFTLAGSSTSLGNGYIYINKSFAIGEALVLKIKTNSAGTTVFLDEVIVEGIKNKSTDTTWVTTT